MSDENQLRPVGSPSRRAPFFFREENSSLIAKGNFLTLAAKPEHVDKGEWLAHQGRWLLIGWRTGELTLP